VNPLDALINLGEAPPDDGPSSGGARRRQIAWYRTPLPKEVLKQLSQRSDIRGFIQVFSFYGLYFGMIALALYSFGHWHWAITAMLVWLHGTVASFNGGCALHELNHGTVFRTKWLNAFFAHIAGLTSWWSVIGFHTSHQRHHAFTLHQPDDREVTQPMSLKLRWWQYLHIVFMNPLSPFYGIRSTVRIARGQFVNDWDKGLFENDPPKHARFRRWAWTLLFFHGTLLVTCVTLAITLKLYPLLLLPVMISCGPWIGSWLVWLCSTPQHFGLLDDVPDFRLSCRTFTTNPLVSMLYWHMEYHIDHHMYPMVPCYNLKKLHRAIEYDLPPTPRGLWACWKDVRQIVQKQKENPKYMHRVDLPPANRTVAPMPNASLQPADVEQETQLQAQT